MSIIVKWPLCTLEKKKILDAHSVLRSVGIPSNLWEFCSSITLIESFLPGSCFISFNLCSNQRSACTPFNNSLWWTGWWMVRVWKACSFCRVEGEAITQFLREVLSGQVDRTVYVAARNINSARFFKNLFDSGAPMRFWLFRETEIWATGWYLRFRNVYSCLSWRCETRGKIA